eukprot:1394530-Amorphochlora_amoeboformis.AAC.1
MRERKRERETNRERDRNENIETLSKIHWRSLEIPEITGDRLIRYYQLATGLRLGDKAPCQPPSSPLLPLPLKIVT